MYSSSISLYVLFVWSFYEYVYYVSCALKRGYVTFTEQRSQAKTQVEAQVAQVEKSPQVIKLT